MKTDLTQEQVREIFDYNEINGWSIRKFKNGKRKPCGHKPDANGYGQVKIAGKMYKTHRIIWLWHHGSWPDGEIDHIDRNRMNNRIDNLRVVSASENQHNHSIQRNNTSGYLGVVWNKRANKFMARIRVNRKEINLGYFDSKEDAYRAYQLAKIKCHPTSPIAQQYRIELGLD